MSHKQQMSLPKLKQKILSSKFEADENQIIVRVVDYLEERVRSSKTGKTYTRITVNYDWIDNPVSLSSDKKPFKYLTASFSESGKTVRESNLQAGDIYKVTTAINDRDYDEWVKLEHLFIDSEMSNQE